MQELIWFFVFMIAAVLAIGAIVWYIDRREEKGKAVKG